MLQLPFYKSAKEGGGEHSFDCFHIYHKRVPMSCMFRATRSPLKENNWADDNIQQNHQRLGVLTAQLLEPYLVTLSMV